MKKSRGSSRQPACQAITSIWKHSTPKVARPNTYLATIASAPRTSYRYRRAWRAAFHGWAMLGLRLIPLNFKSRATSVQGHCSAPNCLGVRYTFFDTNADPDVARVVLNSASHTLDASEAYSMLSGAPSGNVHVGTVTGDVARMLGAGQVHALFERLTHGLDAAIETQLRAKFGEVEILPFARACAAQMTCHFLCGSEFTESITESLRHLLETTEQEARVVKFALPAGGATTARDGSARDELIEALTCECQRRASQDHLPNDFLQSLMSLEDSTTEHAHRRVAATAVDVMLAGQTNTTLAIAGVLLDLIDHPRHFSTVHEELVTDPSEHQQVDDLRRFVHLHRCITETLRLRSLGFLWRFAHQPMVVGRHRIPAGDLVGSCLGLINLDPNRYPDPLRYDPDRLRAMETDRYQNPAHVQVPPEFAAFGAGPQRCPGRSLAYATIALAVARLIRDYKWQVIARPRRWVQPFTPGMCRPMGRFTFRYKRLEPGQRGA